MSGPKEPSWWDLAIDRAQRGGAFTHIPLLEAGKAGLIDLVVIMDPKASLPFGRMRKAKLPVLVLVADDGDDPAGPAGWRCAAQVTQWARGAIVHGSGAQRSHYELAVRATLTCQRFLMVETPSRYIQDWGNLLTHVQTLAIVPTGGHHPVAQPPVTIH